MKKKFNPFITEVKTKLAKTYIIHSCDEKTRGPYSLNCDKTSGLYHNRFNCEYEPSKPSYPERKPGHFVYDCEIPTPYPPP